jgi:hypothetical protein
MTNSNNILLPARPGKGPNPFRAFDEIADELIGEWEKRNTQKEKLSPYESANGFLKREAYRIITHYLAHGRASFFEHVIRKDGRALTSRVHLEENPFHFGLLALFADDSVVTRQDRSLFASQMLYAYHHGVPPTFLIGFIYQAGSKEEIKRKLREGHVEAGFEKTHKRYIKDVKLGSFR